MDQSQAVFVRGRCVCGRRYRIRGARAGITVMCPICRRPIPITDADIRAALADARLIPVQVEDPRLLEALPLDYGELRLAPEGSRPGLTGHAVPSHEEALLARAAWGKGLAVHEGPHPVPAVAAPAVVIELETGGRTFVYDLLLSFCCAGVLRNALNILVMAVACSVVAALHYVLALFPILALLMLAIYGIIVLYAVQFYWNVLRLTAEGEDAIPWVQSDLSFWDDAVVPLGWLIIISFLCALPALLAGRYGPAALEWGAPAWWLILAAGWFFWPVAVMSAALGNTLTFLRPDWLVRCVLGIGPLYLVAWGTLIMALAGWYVYLRYAAYWAWIPVVGFAVNLYFGYVVFRMLGLLFRHFRPRFPWKL